MGEMPIPIMSRSPRIIRRVHFSSTTFARSLPKVWAEILQECADSSLLRYGSRKSTARVNCSAMAHTGFSASSSKARWPANR